MRRWCVLAAISSSLAGYVFIGYLIAFHQNPRVSKGFLITYLVNSPIVRFHLVIFNSLSAEQWFFQEGIFIFSLADKNPVIRYNQSIKQISGYEEIKAAWLTRIEKITNSGMRKKRTLVTAICRRAGPISRRTRLWENIDTGWIANNKEPFFTILL